MNKMQNYKYIFGTIILVFLFSISGLAQDVPTATLVSYEKFYTFNSSEQTYPLTVEYEMFFTGKAPFSAQIKVVDENNNVILDNEDAEILNNPNSYIAGSFILTLYPPYPKKLYITISGFKDNNVHQQDPWLTEGISGEVIINFNLLNNDVPSVILESYEIFHCLASNEESSIIINYNLIFTGIPPFDPTIYLVDIDNGNYIKWTPSTFQYHYSDTYKLPVGIDIKKISLSVVEFKDHDVHLTAPDEGITGEILIDIYRVPTPSIIDDNITSCGESVQLSVVPGNQSETYSWSVEGGIGSFSSDNETETIFTAPPSDEFYNITFRQTNIDCFTEIPIKVKLLGSHKGEISTDSEVCGEGDAIIKFDFTNSAVHNFPFTVNYSNGVNNYETTIESLIEYRTHNVSGVSEFKFFTVEDSNNCFAKDEDLIGIAKVIDIKPFVFAGEDVEICGNVISLMANAPNEGESGIWTSSNGSFDNPNNNDVDFITNNQFGDFILTWTITVNDKECSASDNVKVTLWEAPTHPFAGDDITVKSNELVLDAQEPAVGTGFWISSDCVIINPLQHNSVATGFTCEGSMLEWFVVNGVSREVIVERLAGNDTSSESIKTWLNSLQSACYDIDTVTIILATPESIVEQKDITIYTNTMILTAQEPEFGTGFWAVLSGDCKVTNPFQHNSEATGFTLGKSELEWFVVNGVSKVLLMERIFDVSQKSIIEKLNEINACFNSDIITVNYAGLRTPNAFSPGGNGKNDTFVIQGAEQVKNNLLVIFDKNGKVVYKQANYGENGKFWDGKKDGNFVPDGIYNYVFSGKGIKTVKNFLIIKRDNE